MPGAMRRPDDAAARVAPTPTPTPAATPSPATRANPIARRFIPSKVPHQPSLIEKRRFRRSLEIPAAAAATARPPASREPSESSPDALRKSTSSGESVGRADAAAPTDCGGGSTTKRLLGALAGTLRRSSSPRAATLRPEPTRRSGRSCHSAFPGLLQWERGSRDGLQQPEVAASKASLNGLRTCKSWYAGYGTLREDEDHTTLNEQPSWAAGSGLAAPQRIEGGDAGGAEGAGGGAPWAASPAPRRRAALDALLGTLAGRRAASRDSALAAAAPAPLRAAATSASAAALGELPLRPVNRLRSPPGVCSRCSSLLSLAGATGSRYSLDALAGGFVAVAEEPPALAASVVCKLCLEDTAADAATAISMCGCAFCTKCMQSYAEFEITNGAYELSCPDASCRIGGALTLDEIGTLVGSEMLERHKRYKLNHEVVMDASRAWCPRAGCETVCRVAPGSTAAAAATPGPARATQRRRIALPVHCPTCELHFCSDCNQEWHEGLNCEESAARRGGSDTPAAAMLAAAGLPPDSDLIKWCPMCRVPIEKDEGCAQMMCKRCKHVFCWYCLASLDDDFLLRHYDKGPCKNKLGHSRASVIWHRAQVVGIFAGFGLLLLAASPLLLLAAPCIVCCKCRLCGARSRQPLGEDEPVQLDRERPEAD